MIKKHIRFRLIGNLANNLGLVTDDHADVKDKKTDY